ncbi:hypothetical protein ACTA71_009041 [Dictyostelium dimigraforme]
MFFQERNFAYAYEILEYLKKINRDRNGLYDESIYNYIRNDVKCPTNLDEIIELIISHQLESSRTLCFYKQYKTLRGTFPIKTFGSTATISANHLVYEADVIEIFSKLHGPKHRKSKTAMRVFRKEYDLYFPGFHSAFDSFISLCPDCIQKKQISTEKKNHVSKQLDLIKQQLNDLAFKQQLITTQQPPPQQPQIQQLLNNAINQNDQNAIAVENLPTQLPQPIQIQPTYQQQPPQFQQQQQPPPQQQQHHQPQPHPQPQQQQQQQQHHHQQQSPPQQHQSPQQSPQQPKIIQCIKPVVKSNGEKKHTIEINDDSQDDEEVIIEGRNNNNKRQRLITIQINMNE